MKSHADDSGSTSHVFAEHPHASHLTPPWPRLALLLILVLAFWLRLHDLAAQSLWYDEAVTAQVSAQGVADLTRWTAGDIQPPLYYYVVAGWQHLSGRGEWALRFPSAAFGLLLIPMLWVLARRLFGSGRLGAVAGLLAALLAAISPLYVYYGQEARMYTQLTWLGALSGYLLLRALASTGGGSRKSLLLWIAWALAAAAVLYTHYFGLFLLLAYGLYVILVLALGWLPIPARPPGRRELSVALLATLSAGVLYLPWLPAMLTRYRVDRSYWQGTLKLGEALRHFALSVTMGAPETLRESAALRLLPWFGAAFALALLALILWALAQPPHSRARSRRWSTILFLLLVLVVPVVAVLTLASRTPKFNARYLMLVSPVFFLVLGGGLGFLVTGSGLRRAGCGWPGRILALAALGFTILVSVQGSFNWFNDPAFKKAQWRQVASSVSRQMTPDEAVILVSGHAQPAWDYYAPTVPTIDLPDTSILDVDAVLGFDAGATLQGALAGKSGVWLVQWQADAADPLGLVPYYLNRAGSEVPVRGQYWQLVLRHWRLKPDATYPAQPVPQHPDQANYGHKISLLGWDQPQDGQVTVYWQAQAPLLGSDYQVSLRVEDAAGREVGKGWDGRPAGYLYPTGRWLPGNPVFGRYALPKDLPSGEYYLTLAVYDAADPSGLDVIDIANNPSGKRVRLGPWRRSN